MEVCHRTEEPTLMSSQWPNWEQYKPVMAYNPQNKNKYPDITK